MCTDITPTFCHGVCSKTTDSLWIKHHILLVYVINSQLCILKGEKHVTHQEDAVSVHTNRRRFTVQLVEQLLTARWNDLKSISSKTSKLIHKFTAVRLRNNSTVHIEQNQFVFVQINYLFSNITGLKY
jgi:hypothetical protein